MSTHCQILRLIDLKVQPFKKKNNIKPHAFANKLKGKARQGQVYYSKYNTKINDIFSFKNKTCASDVIHTDVRFN